MELLSISFELLTQSLYNPLAEGLSLQDCRSPNLANEALFVWRDLNC